MPVFVWRAKSFALVFLFYPALAINSLWRDEVSWIIEKAISPEIIEHAWRKSRNDNAVWRPGISRREMEKRFVFHIMALAEDLAGGSYTPDPVRRFSINKGDGKTRMITALSLRDKIAQRAVLSVIEPYGEQLFHPDSYAYRPGRNIDNVMDRIQRFISLGFLWAVSTDIMNCFDNIPQGRLLTMVSELIQDDSALQLIEKWVSGSGAHGKLFFRSRRGIPQGAVISPFLCNLYLTPLDNMLSSHGIHFVRYADNILIMTKTRKEAVSACTFLESRVRALDLVLNPQKTEVFHISDGYSFLGRDIYPCAARQVESCRARHPDTLIDFADHFDRLRRFPLADSDVRNFNT